MTRGPKRNEDQRKKVHELFAQGMTYSAISKIVGVSRQRAQQIVRPDPSIYEAVRKRANDSCESCSIPLRIGDGHVHHIKNSEDLNEPEALEYLCRSCHRKKHHYLIGKRADATVTVRIKESQYNWLKETAKKQKVTMTSLTNKIVTEYLKKKGLL